MSTLSEVDFTALEARAHASDRAMRNDPEVPLGMIGQGRLLAELAAGVRMLAEILVRMGQEIDRRIEAAAEAHLENSPHIHADGSTS